LKILLIGRNGQIGWELNRSLTVLGEIAALSRKDLDLMHSDAIRSTIRERLPQIIVNAAGYTAVDQAETEPDVAHQVNGVAPGVMAEEAKTISAVLVHFSTEYVFDGAKAEPYGEADSVRPLNAYGRSKVAGEDAIRDSGCQHIIFRTSWVYASRGKNFLRTILRLAAERTELRIVDDQRGAPTTARMIADATVVALFQALGLNKRQSGLRADCNDVFHLTAAGSTTWFAFARRIVSEAAINGLNVVPTTTANYGSPAARPANSVLSNERFERSFGFRLPDWTVGLDDCLDELREMKMVDNRVEKFTE